LPSSVFAQTHPLSEITPIGVNLDIIFILSLSVLFFLYLLAPREPRKFSIVVSVLYFLLAVYALTFYRLPFALEMNSLFIGLFGGFSVYAFGKFLFAFKKQLANTRGNNISIWYNNNLI